MAHYVYLLACADNTYYCGYTNNPDKRIALHDAGKGAKYTRHRTPVRLAYLQALKTKSDALKLEAKIKTMTRAQKTELVRAYDHQHPPKTIPPTAPIRTRAFFENLELDIFETTYEPAEDTFLLANTIPKKTAKTILDLGTGSGIQGIVALQKNPGARATFADQNPIALACARHNLQKARGIKMDSKTTARYTITHLFTRLKNQTFDLILFNPPYLPTEEPADVALDGGPTGRETIDRFLDQLTPHLSQNGQCLLLQTDQNGTEQTQKRLHKNKLTGQIIARQKLFFEELQIWQINHKKNQTKTTNKKTKTRKNH